MWYQFHNISRALTFFLNRCCIDPTIIFREKYQTSPLARDRSGIVLKATLKLMAKNILYLNPFRVMPAMNLEEKRK